MPRSVMIVDDHPLVREGLKSIIERSPGLRVAGEAGSCEDALAKLRTLSPDVLVVDISLPGKDGIELTRRVRKLFPEVPILIVSVHCRVELIVNAFRAGARGFLAKDAPPKKLLAGIDSVLQGEYFLDGIASTAVVDRLLCGGEGQTLISDERYGRLSAREQQVFRLLVEGHSVKRIAAELYISPKTVENHRASVMVKLEVENLVELVQYAARLGIVDVDAWKY
jgi:DNA-binding NarL/FixJ family response regulator